MAKHLIVLGHGIGPGGAYDPGATGCGTSEDKFLNNEFLPALKKYAPSNVDFYTTKNMFAHREAKSISGYDEITELHLDWANGASGGHVIIYKDYNPDKTDNAIRDVIKQYVGLRMSSGISRRDNLYNLNTFAKRGITYRLIELGFINNEDDMDEIRHNLHGYAIELLSAITGKRIPQMEKGFLARNDRDAAVKELQSELKSLGYNIGVDGSYGPNTEKAVISFQKAHNLKDDGLYGPNTQKALKDALARYSAVANKESEEEQNMADTGFKDVSKDHNLVKAIKKAKTAGITHGVGGNKFAPDDTITRAEAVAFVVRAVELATGKELPEE